MQYYYKNYTKYRQIKHLVQEPHKVSRDRDIIPILSLFLLNLCLKYIKKLKKKYTWDIYMISKVKRVS